MDDAIIFIPFGFVVCGLVVILLTLVAMKIKK